VDNFLNNTKLDVMAVLSILSNEYGITCNGRGGALTTRYIQQRLNDLQSHQKSLTLPSILNGKPSTRHFKDMMYAELNRLVECYIQPKASRSYCGLTAQHLYHISDHFDAAFIVSCEKSNEVFDWVKKLHTVFFNEDNDFCWINKKDIESTGNSQRGMINTDVFSHLSYAKEAGFKNLYNILDLDLMINVKNIPDWNLIAETLYSVMEPTSIISLTTSVGRNITNKEYNEIMPHTLERALYSNGFKLVKVFSGKYLDRKIPMRTEHLMIRK